MNRNVPGYGQKMLIIAGFFLSLAAAAGAQETYTLKHYTNQNGLPVNGIRGIEYDDATGLLWVGTEAGISCYDGNHFQQTNYVRGRAYTMGRLSIDGNSRIYCGTDYYNHLYFIAGSRIIDSGPDTSSVLPLKNYLHSTLDFILSSIRARKKNPVWPLNILPLDKDGNNALIVSTDTLAFKKGDSLTVIRTHVGNYSFFKRRDVILVAFLNQLFRFDLAQQKLVPVAIDGFPVLPENCRFVTNTNTALPLALIDSSLFFLRQSGNRYYLEHCFTGLPPANNILVARYLPGVQAIALGDHSGGLFLLRKKNVAQVQDQSDPPEERTIFTYAQAEIAPNTILIQDGTTISHAGIFTKTQTDIHPDFNIYTSKSGDIFFNRNDRIYQLDKSTGRAPVVASLDDGSYWIIFAETLGQLYIISSFGIYKMGDHSVTPVYQTPPAQDGNPRPAIDNTTAIEISPGLIGITSGNLLLRFQVSTGIMDTVKVSGHAPVRALWQYGNYTFAGTYGEGIFCIRDTVVKPLPVDTRDYLRYTHCFMPDGLGYCWISTNNGLFRASLKAMCHAFEQKDPEPVYYHYLGTDEGMNNQELNGGCQTCAIKLKSGLLSFPSMNGLVQFDPKIINTTPPSGVILMDSVQVDAHYYAPADESLLHIPAQSRNIRFHATIPYWGAIENLYTWYRIKNYNENWISFDSRSQNEFSFNKLPPGAYFFEVKVLTGFLPGEYRIVSVPFTILKPWYLTWWALLIDLILVTALGLFFVKWRTAQIAKQNESLRSLVAERTDELHQKNLLLGNQVSELAQNDELKTRLISIISHNIITPLRYIHRAAASMKSDHKAITPALRQKATDSIRETASELGQLSINILNWIRFQHHNYELKKERFNVEIVLKYVADMIGPIYKEKDLTVLVETKGSGEIVQYKDAVQVIIYNLLINAVNYSETGTITLSALEDPSGILLSVKDEGPGIPQEKISQLLLPKQSATNNPLENKGQGFGYLIIQDLLRLCNATMSIESEPGKGTTIFVAFPSLGNI